MEALMNDIKKLTINRGDVWLADLKGVIGSEQGGIRPVLIVQNNIGNRFSPTVTIVPLTSKRNKGRLPTHILLENERCLSGVSIALVEQIKTIDKGRLINYMGSVNNEIMVEIERAIDIQNKEFDFSYAKNIYKQIAHMNIVLKSMGEIPEIILTKDFLVEQFKNYCLNFNKNYAEIVMNIKNEYIQLKK